MASRIVADKWITLPDEGCFSTTIQERVWIPSVNPPGQKKPLAELLYSEKVGI